MDYRKVIFENAEVGFDYRIDLAGMYVIRFNGKFEPIHAAHSRRPYIINPTNHNKVFLMGSALEALERAIVWIGI